MYFFLFLLLFLAVSGQVKMQSLNFKWHCILASSDNKVILFAIKSAAYFQKINNGNGCKHWRIIDSQTWLGYHPFCDLPTKPLLRFEPLHCNICQCHHLIRNPHWPNWHSRVNPYESTVLFQSTKVYTTPPIINIVHWHLLWKSEEDTLNGCDTDRKLPLKRC